MNRRIIYLTNPISGTANKKRVLKAVEDATYSRGIPFEILPTNAGGDYSFIQEKIYKEGVTDIVLCGGDGTVSQVAGALRGAPVQFGIIPLGSGNGLAYAAKIPKNHLQALEIIFQGYAAGIDAFFINGRFSCMLCGLGFDAQVAHDFARQPTRGLGTYIRQTVSNFFRAKPYPFRITAMGKTFTTEAYFISIANSNQFGNQFTIAPQASLNDGLLDIVVVTKMSKLKLLFAVLQQIKRGTVLEFDESISRQKNVLYFQADKLQLENPGGAPLHIDGDPAETGSSMMIEIIPNAFKLIQPLPINTGK
ncbi:MAG TPA: diacylglycerol kinase family lipid kinase [Ferruginibacter sp.]|nr:diacylglycerol kinase family lipid kinase [Ferruginibacter sp.]HMP19551.1 diacylglycerol kinase family lipid kinase [Ferruginibacter sp.]